MTFFRLTAGEFTRTAGGHSRTPEFLCWMNFSKIRLSPHCGWVDPHCGWCIRTRETSCVLNFLKIRLSPECGWVDPHCGWVIRTHGDFCVDKSTKCWVRVDWPALRMDWPALRVDWPALESSASALASDFFWIVISKPSASGRPALRMGASALGGFSV
jgi:predicted small metal-binding protein